MMNAAHIDDVSATDTDTAYEKPTHSTSASHAVRTAGRLLLPQFSAAR
jgi:hypothetical protein